MRTYFRGETDDDAATMPTGLDPAAQQEDEEDAAKRREAKEVTPAEAAFLAGIISSPSMYDPVENPRRATQRRNLVLDRMLEQGLISKGEHTDAIDDALPTESEIDPPQPDSDQPYFTSWLTQQLVDRYKAPAVFSGGLKVTTTLDPELQASAEQAINGRLAGVGPSASLVAIENKTGEVKAMVGGTDFEKKPFNLATNGHRQPGSAFKPFILIRALQDGVSPEATFTSQKKEFPVPNSKGEKFVVNNYEGSYSGIASLRAATSRSDNSVYAELGLKVKTKRVAELAQRMGIKTEVSTNPAMTLGGLKEGVTPLEMAYAYSTIANRGVKVSGQPRLIRGRAGRDPGGRRRRQGRRERGAQRRGCSPPDVADTAQELLSGVVLGGTGKAAQIGEFAAGKTGTTENYGDAWFVGFNKELTVAVWVGYPDELKYMKTEYRGGEVAGGTFPTEIWHDFMRSWIEHPRAARGGERQEGRRRGGRERPYAPATARGAARGRAPAQPSPRADGGEEAPKQRAPSQPNTAGSHPGTGSHAGARSDPRAHSAAGRRPGRRRGARLAAAAHRARPGPRHAGARACRRSATAGPSPR